MAGVIRMCNPYNFALILEYEDSRFKGVMGDAINEMISDLKRAANVTFEIRSQNDGVGERVNNSSQQYTGCIGLLQQNQSDLITQVVTYPIDAENITQGDVVTFSSVQMYNTYTGSDDLLREKVLQVESCFLSFSWAVWLLSLVTFFAALSAFYTSRIIRMKMARKRLSMQGANRYPSYQVLVHMSRFGELFNPKGPFKCLLFLILSLFSLMVVFYFSASISTDLVVVQPPSTVRTYKEHLDQQVALMFISGTDVYTHFKFAPEGSEEKRLWDLSVSKLTESGVLVEPVPEASGKIVKAIYARKATLVLDSQFAAMSMKEGCGLILKQSKLDMISTYLGLKKLKVKEQIPLLSQDANAKYFMKGYILNVHQSATSRKLQRIFRQFLETGLTSKQEIDVKNANLLDTVLQLPKDGPQDMDIVEKCEQGILLKPDSHFNALALVNIKNFVKHLLFICLFNFCILLAEITCSRTAKRSGQARR